MHKHISMANSHSSGEGKWMKLQQGQVWKKGDRYYRIVEWARLSIGYKLMSDLESGEGAHHTATKKEFCRLIKGAELVPEQVPEVEPEPGVE